MKNVFENVKDKEMKEYYADYIGSKELGISVSSFKEYAKEINEKYFPNLEYQLGMCMTLAEKMFFEEVANRYFQNK